MWKVAISKVGSAPVAVLSAALMSLPLELSNFRSTFLFGLTRNEGKGSGG